METEIEIEDETSIFDDIARTQFENINNFGGLGLGTSSNINAFDQWWETTTWVKGDKARIYVKTPKGAKFGHYDVVAKKFTLTSTIKASNDQIAVFTEKCGAMAKEEIERKEEILNHLYGCKQK